MTAMMLVVTVGARRAAFAAERVHSVIEPGGGVPVPGAPVHIAGLAALRSRPLTLIDVRAALGIVPADATGEMGQAVAVEQAGHLYGLLVDRADDIVPAVGEPVAVASDPGAGWREAAVGVIESPLGPLLLLDIAALIAGPPQTRAT